jgi:di/tricarboxylate transporter
MIATRCCRLSEARRSVDWQVLITIAAALALGRALELSGAANYIAHEMIGLAGGHPLWTLIAVYGATMVMTEFITNNAAAVLIFPIGMATAATLGVEPMPFIIAIMLAASASFSTPIGYQTNLMVYGIGGYRFGDYLRMGVPLNLLLWILGCLLIPLIYPLRPVVTP